MGFSEVKASRRPETDWPREQRDRWEKMHSEVSECSGPSCWDLRRGLQDTQLGGVGARAGDGGRQGLEHTQA